MLTKNICWVYNQNYEGTLIDNNFTTQCKIYLKTENKSGGKK